MKQMITIVLGQQCVQSDLALECLAVKVLLAASIEVSGDNESKL